MAGVVSSNFRLHNAEQFKEAFSETTPDIMHVFVGKPSEWDDDTTPPTPNNSPKPISYDIWKDMIAAKRIQVADTTFALIRRDWTSGTIYTEYSDDNGSLYSSAFYALTDDYNVYKCLYNNKGGQSTVQPTGTSNSAITTADGYIWKYMYSISAGDVLKFFTSGYMPVSFLSSNNGSAQWAVQQAAANGGINVVDVTSGGSGYPGDGGTLQAITNSSVVTLRAAASGTDNIYNGSTIYIAGGLGAGQLRTILDYNGTTKALTVNTGFSPSPNTSSTYVVSPKVNMVGDGAGFSAYSTVVGTAISKVTVINAGANFSQTAVTLTSNGGSGAVLAGYLPPPMGHGANAVSELGGFNVMLNVKLEGTESNTFTVGNDYRKIGILKNPRLAANGDLATGIAYDQTTRLTVSGPSGTFLADELVTGDSSGATGIVVDYTGNTQVRVIPQTGVFTGADNITGNTSAATANVGTVTIGDLRPYTGQVLYLEHRSPVTRSDTQTEDIKIVVLF